MSHFSVISDVSRSLQGLLDGQLTAPESIEVSTTSPQRVTLNTDRLLNLYLYQVVEDPHAKNRPPIPVGPDRLRPPPLALNLYYLMTPYAKDEQDNKDEHLILGEAMRILYEHSTLTDPYLEGGLKGRGEEVRLVLCPTNLEELTRIWNSLQMSYRLSVCYEARVLLVDAGTERDADRVKVHETLYRSL
jgi:hypothetical protein